MAFWLVGTVVWSGGCFVFGFVGAEDAAEDGCEGAAALDVQVILRASQFGTSAIRREWVGRKHTLIWGIGVGERGKCRIHDTSPGRAGVVAVGASLLNKKIELIQGVGMCGSGSMSTLRNRITWMRRYNMDFSVKLA